MARALTVTLDEAFRESMAHHDWPLAVRRFVGEVLTAGVLVRGTMAYRGPTVIQIQGDGPLRLVIAEVDENFRFRMCAMMEPGAKIDDNASMETLVNAHGQGRCGLILEDQDSESQPYQGIVPLTGKNFAEAITAFFIQSEQVQTQFEIACDGERAGGIMLQKMPELGGKLDEEKKDEDGWNRLSHFVSSVQSKELLTLDPATINHRLFWEEKPQIIGEYKPYFQCDCSLDKIENMVRMMGKADALDALNDEGVLEAQCRYCGKTYRLTHDDIEKAFEHDEATSKVSGVTSKDIN